VDDHPCDQKTPSMEDKRDSFANETAIEGSFSSVSSEKSPRVADSLSQLTLKGKKILGYGSITQEVKFHKYGSLEKERVGALIPKFTGSLMIP